MFGVIKWAYLTISCVKVGCRKNHWKNTNCFDFIHIHYTIWMFRLYVMFLLKCQAMLHDQLAPFYQKISSILLYCYYYYYLLLIRWNQLYFCLCSWSIHYLCLSRVRSWWHQAKQEFTDVSPQVTLSRLSWGTLWLFQVRWDTLYHPSLQVVGMHQCLIPVRHGQKLSKGSPTSL